MGYKVKKIYVGTQQVRPVWTPGSNTLAYFPLAEDGLDKTGNYTLSNTGTSTAGYLGRTFTDNSIFNSSPTKAKTFSCWIKINSMSGSGGWVATLGRLLTRNYNMVLGGFSPDYSNAPGFFIYYNDIYWGGSNLFSTGTWNHIVMTYESSGLYGYCNGTKYTVYSGSISGAPDTPRLVGLSGTTSNVTISEVILESKIWTQSEIQDYYNNTKGNYGL